MRVRNETLTLAHGRAHRPGDTGGDGMTETEWAQDAARQILENYGHAGSIDTANYQECGFIIESAKLALIDDMFAKSIGMHMEPER